MQGVPVGVCQSLCNQASIDFYDRCKEFVKNNNGIGVYSIYNIFNQTMLELYQQFGEYSNSEEDTQCMKMIS